ncbi:DUF1707 domain-containing protein [Thermopolyspora sp. NPDC052614]|uniref:DUF1707 SHOCT-like domain-containing protein n=1 Tax=Thermopolyspora sp. NPDC052614 TaxID=3155682 RepID=UPI003439EB40
MNDPGELRVSDAEREAVVERLREASVEGRLTLAELTERTEAAYLAVTYGELAQVTADLPGPGPASGVGVSPVPPPRPPAQAEGKKRRWFVAVMGDTKRRGKWRVDGEIGGAAVMGDVTLDLREAEVRGNEIDIMAVSVMGDVKIIVPDGVDVDLSGVTIMGDKKIRVQEAPPGQNVPVVRVRAYAIMGDVKIIGDSHADPIRRGWFAWSDWWLERRAQKAGQSPDALGHSLGLPPHGMRDLHRYTKEQMREVKREIGRQVRDVKRQARDIGRGHLPPPPPPPPPPPYPHR